MVERTDVMDKQEFERRHAEQLELLNSLENRVEDLQRRSDSGDLSGLVAELQDIVAKLDGHSAETAEMLEARRAEDPTFGYNYDIAKAKLDGANKSLVHIKRAVKMLEVMLALKPKEDASGQDTQN